MRTSWQGILEIFEHEGVCPAPYLDSQGYWTFGVGHTHFAGGLDPRKMKRGMPDDLDAAIDLALKTFRTDVVKFENRVNAAVHVPLTQYQFDALVSFDFNTGGIHRAKLTEALNAGDYNEAARRFMGWLRPPEIRKRRTAEMNLFATGNYDANGSEIAVWNVDKRGRLQGVREVLNGEDLLVRMNRVDNVKPFPRRTVKDWIWDWAA